MGRRSIGPRARLLAVVAGLFAVIFTARMLTDSLGSGVGFLYVVPIVLVGVEMGRRAGIAAGFAAVGLFAVWAALSGEDLPRVGYVSRVLVFVGVGAATGHMSERLRSALAEARATARHFEVARDLLCTSDADGRLVRINGSWEEVLGWSREELMTRPFLDFVHPDDRDRTEHEAAKLWEGDFTASFTNRYATRDGGWRWIEWSSKADPEERLIHSAARDVTDRRAAEHSLRVAEERFRRAFEDSAVGMALVGMVGAERDRILASNESLAHLLGLPREELLGTATLQGFTHPDDLPRVTEEMRELLDGDIPVLRCELRMVRPDGVAIWTDLTTSVIRDDDGRPLYRLSQVVDIDARKKAVEQLRHLADHDPLSGVFNRRRFEEEVERELGHAAQRGSTGAVLLLDVDGFKRINDTLGHAMGDAVISRIGESLTSRLRSGDVIARLGGDEFAVLLRRVSLGEAKNVAATVLTIVGDGLARLETDGLGDVTASIGVAAFGGDSGAPTPDTLLGRADRAMYEAKRAGGDGLRAYAPGTAPALD